MNPFEKFTNIPQPDSARQLESVEETEKRHHVSEAIIALEGAVMYSSQISEQTKNDFLSRLNELKIPSEAELEHFYAHEQRGTTAQQTASLWVSRELRGRIRTSEEEQAEIDTILHNLYL